MICAPLAQYLPLWLILKGNFINAESYSLKVQYFGFSSVIIVSGMNCHGNDHQLQW